MTPPEEHGLPQKDDRGPDHGQPKGVLANPRQGDAESTPMSQRRRMKEKLT
jgi:hypothetical protein